MGSKYDDDLSGNCFRIDDVLYGWSQVKGMTDTIEALTAENKDLQHDIARHIAITAEQAGEIVRLRGALLEIAVAMDAYGVRYCLATAKGALLPPTDNSGEDK